jgi:hypothetical protein
MSKNFSDSEKNLLSFCKFGEVFVFQGKKCKILDSGKPVSKKGEPKTDLYIEFQELKSSKIGEIKISYKQANADFLENKISKERATQILGKNWSSIIQNSLKPLKDKFETRKLIYKSKFGNTKEGSFTLGWKFEFMNKIAGNLSGEMVLSKNEVIDIYSGVNLSEDKKDSVVNTKIRINSGIASHILSIDVEYITNLQDIIDNIQTIEEFLSDASLSKIYFACKALNYRSLENKFDGDRPLSVSVNWIIKNGKLSPELVYDQPLEMGGNQVYQVLMHSMETLKIKDSNDISTKNLKNYSDIVHE